MVSGDIEINTLGIIKQILRFLEERLAIKDNFVLYLLPVVPR